MVYLVGKCFHVEVISHYGVRVTGNETGVLGENPRPALRTRCHIQRVSREFLTGVVTSECYTTWRPQSLSAAFSFPNNSDTVPVQLAGQGWEFLRYVV